MDSLMRKVVVITGASSGIGAASAVELAKRSARLVLHGRNQQNLAAVRQQCIDTGLRFNDVVIVTGDLNEEATIKKIIQAARDHFGTLHILVNNAGYLHKDDGPIQSGEGVDALDCMYNIHLRATYLLVQESLPELMKNKGVVINCSSGFSRVPDPRHTATCITKAALDQLTRILALSLGPKGVRVVGLNPGFVPTNLIDRKHGEGAGKAYFEAVALGSPFQQKLATPAEIANVVAFLASNQSSAITAHSLFCDLGATLTNPVLDFTQL